MVPKKILPHTYPMIHILPLIPWSICYHISHDPNTYYHISHDTYRYYHISHDPYTTTYPMIHIVPHIPWSIYYHISNDPYNTNYPMIHTLPQSNRKQYDNYGVVFKIMPVKYLLTVSKKRQNQSNKLIKMKYSRKLNFRIEMVSWYIIIITIVWWRKVTECAQILFF
jgi:hypothetical protein